LLVFSLKRSRFNLDLQYRPQIWISEGQSQLDFASQVVDLHTQRYLTRSWTLNITDQFQSAPDRARLAQGAFFSNYDTGTSTQNPFLATGRHFLTNAFTTSADHAFSARNHLNLLFRTHYIHLSALDDPAAAQAGDTFAGVTQEHDFGGQIGWTHTFGRDHDFGILYAYDREYFQDFQDSAQLHSVILTYSMRLRPSLLMRLTGGPTLMQPAAPKGAVAPPGSRKTYQVSGSLYKTFRRSAMTLSYSRNNNFTGQISDDLNDRLDLSYSKKFFRRMDVTAGGAFVRQNYSVGTHLLGKSGWLEVDYRLGRAWSIYSMYSYLTQRSGPAPFGPSQLVMTGIRWSWDSEPRGNAH